MPQRKAAQKRLRADKKRRQRNIVIKRKIKEATKKYLKALDAKNTEEAKKTLHAVYAQLDKAASKNYLHRSKASRRKARLAKKLHALVG